MTKEEIAAMKAADAAEKNAYTKLAVMALIMHGMCMAGAHEDLLVKDFNTDEGRRKDLENAENLGVTCELIADQLLVRSGLFVVATEGETGGAA